MTENENVDTAATRVVESDPDRQWVYFVAYAYKSTFSSRQHLDGMASCVVGIEHRISGLDDLTAVKQLIEDLPGVTGYVVPVNLQLLTAPAYFCCVQCDVQHRRVSGAVGDLWPDE